MKKGEIMCQEQRSKISLAHLGQSLTQAHKDNLKRAWKTRRPVSAEAEQRRLHNLRIVISSQEYRKKMSDVLKGKPKALEAVEKRSGAKHYNWKGGITPLVRKIRNSIQYKRWRAAVFERDNYTCVWCGKSGGDLNADHIKPFATFPKLRFDIENGRTLCVPCHRTTFKNHV